MLDTSNPEESKWYFPSEGITKVSSDVNLELAWKRPMNELVEDDTALSIVYVLMWKVENSIDWSHLYSVNNINILLIIVYFSLFEYAVDVHKLF